MANDEVQGSHEPEPVLAPIDSDKLRCSFCGKAHAEVETMVCGPTSSVAICNECVELCNEIMGEERSGPTEAA